ncbi:MAG: hypothetical protein MIO92_04230, partial [Methanosarcinaceae archaeon]|nr:hypothetical protein [Methanosarcinaceae archaeon]
MKRFFVFMIVVFFLSACAHGPVYTAKSEGDAIKKDYQDKRLQELYNQNQNLLKELYARFTSSRVDIYKDGLGFTDFTSTKNVRTYYLMVKVRPQEIMYKEMKYTPEERFSEVLQKYVPKYIKYIKKSDFDIRSIEGLTFGIYWPVRDVCDTYGGFIEYIEIYTPKQFVNEYLDGKITFQEMLLD